MARDLTFRVMIAVEQEDRNSGLCQPAHLFHEKETGLIVAPIAVVEIASDDHEGHLIFDRLAHEIIERHAGCRSDPFGSGALLPRKSLEGAIQMNVASMNEAKRLQK